jgi:hypothetical protein
VAVAGRRQRGLPGRRVTLDAWLPPRPMAQQRVDAGGDGVLGGQAKLPQ